VTNPVLPSREKAMARGRGPVGMRATTASFFVSTATTWLSCSDVT
jgi:hypothetical protein